MKCTDKSPHLRLLAESFPDHEHCIENLYENNQAFHELCEHFYDCFEAIAHWQKMNTLNSEKILEEYFELQKALEKEIGQLLFAGDKPYSRRKPAQSDDSSAKLGKSSGQPF